MPTTDPRIDAYIAKSPEFARPILSHLRTQIHAACPQVHETMKWNFPFFMYGDQILCCAAAFKAHCRFGFWKWRGKTATGNSEMFEQFGHITAVEDLPKP